MEELIRISPGFGGFDFPYDKAEVVFLGIPLDVTSSYRAGYRFAPAKIREASANLETYLPEFGLDVFETLNITDMGDVVPTPTDMESTGERIKKFVSRIVKDGKFPILLGGEHTLTYFSIQAFDDLFLIHLDAHRDLRDEYLGDRVCHATVARRVLDLLEADRLIQVGIRSCSKEEAEYAKTKKIKSFSSAELQASIARIVSEVKQTVASHPVYLTIDLDVLDPAFAPAVATPEPGGLTVSELFTFIREVRDLNLVGCDIVEFVPPYDNGNTAFVAAKTAYHVLGVLSLKKATT